MKEVSGNISQLRNVPGALDSTRANPSRGNANLDSTAFKEQLQALQNSMPSVQSGAATRGPEALKFSNHAVDRMRLRGISFSPEQMAKIESAVGKAAAKGAKESLLLTDDAALIVSVKDKTVVTVMDKTSLKENVFTNIDSAVMV